jgi:hypothetical protein
MLVQLPGGTAIDSEGTVVAAADNGEIRLHTTQALSRLIEFWKNKPNLRGLLADYTDEIQEIESMLWDVIVLRLPLYAGAAQLDALGKLVGEPRNGLGDAAYRVRIQARIAINNSLGRPRDVIHVLRLIEAALFGYLEIPNASFQIHYREVPSTASAAHEIPVIVAETRAGGVGALVTQPTDATRGGFWGDDVDTAQADQWGDDTDTTAGQVFGTADRA